MIFPFFIAKRYFFSGQTKTAVNIISFISLIGVTIGTAALVLLLSVFNGFEDLLLSMYNSFDPHLKITSNEGKTFSAENINLALSENEDILYKLLNNKTPIIPRISDGNVNLDIRSVFEYQDNEIAEFLNLV